MATIYKTKPSKREKDIIYVTFIKSGLSISYARMHCLAYNSSLTEKQIQNNVSYAVLDNNFRRDQFYQLIGDKLIAEDLLK